MEIRLQKRHPGWEGGDDNVGMMPEVNGMLGVHFVGIALSREVGVLLFSSCFGETLFGLWVPFWEPTRAFCFCFGLQLGCYLIFSTFFI